MPTSEGGYKQFKIGDLFEISTPKKRFNANTIKFGGLYPYVVRTSSNNGIRGYITEDTQYLNDANTISFGQDTATIFYQTKPYFTGDKIKVLSFKQRELNERLATYLLVVMRKAFSLFAWGVSSFDVKVLNDVEVSLPVNKSGKIDFEFIESRVRELEEERVRELEEYLRVSNFSDCSLSLAEKNALLHAENKTIKFKPVRIDKLFDIATGRDIIIGRTKEGAIPLISHQHDNNGISKRVSQIADRRLFNYETTIPLADRGVFLATTQAENFHIGTRVKALTFKNGKQSENVRLYFVTVINQLQVLFTEYLTNATDNLPNLQISVPVDDKGAIDYAFMETYINAVKKENIARLKEFIEREHKAYLKAIQQVSENQEEQEDIKITLIHPDYQPGRIPLYTLRAACGYFEDGQVPEEEGWIDASGLGFTPDPKRHFAVHAKGDSMLPKIKDGDICIFEWYDICNAGSRNGEIVLTQSREYDSEYGGKYTIKRYLSEKVVTEEGWQHSKVELQPLNPDFDPIELDEFGDYKTIGIFKCVL